MFPDNKPDVDMIETAFPKKEYPLVMKTGDDPVKMKEVEEFIKKDATYTVEEVKAE
jgi:hypothetical protein